MSKLTDWIRENMYPGGEVTLAVLQQAFKATLPARQRRDWPCGRIEQDLITAGYMLDNRGRKDQPKRVVVDISFATPAIDGGLQKKIVRQLMARVVYRYTSSSVPLNGESPRDYEGWDWRLIVSERPDYTPERYRISYAEIGARLSEMGIRANASIVKVAFAQEAQSRQELYTAAAGWAYEEVEDELNKYVRCLTPDAMVNYRWRENGDDASADYYGPYVPAEGRASLVTVLDKAMIA